ncbi:dual specificity protein kinase kns1 [Boothiomyces macroporosus]|uniref:Dual specificity protein kinase kns1 n=1 Tax=Boothiomyces macroporosus TaxID=261099 RepID=A0AAD5UJN6_9FUNG|nr:dual specificity protein kinase kns1 [Boothiomyces macroporosus]
MSSKRRRYSSSPSYHGRKRKTDYYYTEPRRSTRKTNTIIQLLGQGTFGKVVEAYDNQTQTKCAIKIIKSVQKYIDASKIEIRVLKKILERDPTGSK